MPAKKIAAKKPVKKIAKKVVTKAKVAAKPMKACGSRCKTK